MGDFTTEQRIFEADAKALWDLTKNQGEGLKWSTDPVALDPESVGSLLIPNEQSPQVALDVFPVCDGQIIRSQPTRVPLVTGHISQFETHSVRDYKAVKQSRDKNLPHPLSLEAACNRLLEEAGISVELKPDTNVVNIVGFIPLRSGRYETNFSPIFYSRDGSWGYPTFVQDRSIDRVLVGHGRQFVPIPDDPDGKNKSPYFKADSIGSFSSVERLMLPENSSRMIVVALPVNEKNPDTPLFLSYRPDQSRLGDAYRSFGGGATRSVRADDIDISTGVDSRRDYTKVKVSSDLSRNPIIYHFRLIGITQENLPTINPDVIKGLYEGAGKTK